MAVISCSLLPAMIDYGPLASERSGAWPEDFLGEMCRLGFKIFHTAVEGRSENLTPDLFAAIVHERESTTLFFSRDDLSRQETASG